jgi:hypothetical protein
MPSVLASRISFRLTPAQRDNQLAGVFCAGLGGGACAWAITALLKTSAAFRGHWRDSNVRKACIVERLAYRAILLRVVHELGHRGKRGRLAFRHRDRNADLLKCSIS